MRASSQLVAIAALTAACSVRAPATKEQLGSQLFSDPGLSNPAGQACADCHAPSAAFRDPESDRSTSAGAVAGRFGPRNSPTVLYARFIPPLQTAGEPSGGLFWDGRVDTLEDQAAKPLLNPLEMNNPDKASVVAAVRKATYARDFLAVFGPTSLDDVDVAFADVTEALAAFERTEALAPFSSKYDRYLAGTELLTPHEARGLAIFEDPARGNCAGCHPSRPGADGSPPLFTSFTYANLGIPTYANSKFFLQPPPLNPDGDRYIDHGLALTTGDPQHDGMFRAPTLRNIARTAPYGHNGYFENLPFMLEFLSTRDLGSRVIGTCSRAPDAPAVPCPWPPAEVPATVERTAVGHLGLDAQELADLAAFLGTLTDE